MPTTPNKNFEVQVTGSNSGTWGDILNNDMISIADSNLGGIVTKSVAGSNITLTSDEAENCIIRLTGAQSADVTVTNPCIGFYFVENLTTNAFAITVTNGVAGVVVPKGRSTVIADTTNGCRAFGNYGYVTGTKQLFFNSTAPTGWTKDTSFDNGTIRLVSGNIGIDGGSSGFTSVFTARTILQANIPSYSLPVTDPGHAHVYRTSQPQGGANTLAAGSSQNNNFSSVTNSATTGISVESGGSGTAMDFAVKYADAIRAAFN